MNEFLVLGAMTLLLGGVTVLLKLTARQPVRVEVRARGRVANRKA